MLPGSNQMIPRQTKSSEKLADDGEMISATSGRTLRELKSTPEPANHGLMDTGIEEARSQQFLFLERVEDGIMTDNKYNKTKGIHTRHYIVKSWNLPDERMFSASRPNRQIVRWLQGLQGTA